MRLTTQMAAEIEKIRKRAEHINQQVYSFLDSERNVTFERKDWIDSSIQELTTFKVRLENLLCETDKKE